MLKTLNLLVIFFFVVSCSTTPVVMGTPETEKSRKVEMSAEAPSWASKIQFIEGGMHFFTGRSGGDTDEGICHEKALKDALHQLSRYVKVELKSLSKSYEELAAGESAEMVTAVTSERGAFIILKEYSTDYFSELRYTGGTLFHNCFVKIGITIPQMEEIKIRAADLTSWNYEINGECVKKGEAESFFKEISSVLGWKLTSDSKNKDTAFNVKADLSCENDKISFGFSRVDNIEKAIILSASAKGSDLSELRSELLKQVRVTPPLISFPEYPDIEKDSIFNELDTDLLKKYASALEFEKKGRLFPEKALNGWIALSEYAGKNPFRELALERISFYNKFSELKNNIERMEKADRAKITEVAKLSSLPENELKGIFINYFETYGALSGKEVVNQLFDLVTPQKKKENLKKLVFQESSFIEKWKMSCSNGDGAKCYLLSFTNDAQSREYKKNACMFNVLSGCRELAEDALDSKQGQSAVYFGEKACHLGEKEWCFKAAKVLYSGENGVKVDVFKSLPLLMDSCNANDVRGCAYLGFMYEKGEGVKPDKAKAKEFYDRACELGFKESCNKIKE